MRFRVVCMRERGRVLDERALVQVVPHFGELRVEHVQDGQLRRPLRIARLLRLDRTVDADLLPPLLDACLVGMATQGFTLTGFERSGEICFAQSWWIREP